MQSIIPVKQTKADVQQQLGEKKEIQDWLDKKNISYTPKDTKPILLTRSKEIVVPKKFEIEEITRRFSEKNGKDINVLRLPVGHSELNPIELIWALVKTDAAKKNTTFKIADVKQLVEQSLSSVNRENWRKAVDHTKKVEKAFSDIDFGEKGPKQIEKVIISLDSQSSDSEDLSSSSSDDEF